MITIKHFDRYSLEYQMAMNLLIKNLPFEDMRTTASRLFANPNNPNKTWAGIDENVVVGTLVGGPLREGISYLEFLWIHSDYRKAGLGTRILTQFEQHQKSLGSQRIETEIYEEQVARCAKKMGYKETNRQGKLICLVKNI